MSIAKGSKTILPAGLHAERLLHLRQDAVQRRGGADRAALPELAAQLQRSVLKRTVVHLQNIASSEATKTTLRIRCDNWLGRIAQADDR